MSLLKRDSSKRYKKDVRAVTPLIATVVLIVVVVVIIGILFVWFRGTLREEITKFNTDIRLKCNEALEGLQASYSISTSTLQLVNNGNTAIFDFQVKNIKGGSRETEDLSDKVTDWGNGLTVGKSASYTVTFDAEKIELHPILLGDSSQGQKTWVCDESIELDVA